MKIAMISTWRCACGVAKYTEELCNELSKKVELKIFAEKTDKELESINPNITIPYERHYIRGGSYDETLLAILEYKPDIAHIQFESSMYQEVYNLNSPFLRFLADLRKAGIKTFVTLHNVLPNPNFTSQEILNIKMWYNNLDSRVILGNDAVYQEFTKWAPQYLSDKRAHVIPLGSTIFTSISKKEASEKLKLDENNFYIVQPGFYGADKGMIQLIHALPKILAKYPNTKLVFAGGLHPQAPELWKIHTRDCIKEIIKRKLEKNVMILGRFVGEDELNVWLSLADVVSLNYHWISGLFSASASAHRVLRCERPIVMNSQDVRLSEFLDNVHCKKTDDEHYAEAILKCYEDKEFAKKISKRASEYARETTFEKIAEKHLELYSKSL